MASAQQKSSFLIGRGLLKTGNTLSLDATGILGAGAPGGTGGTSTNSFAPIILCVKGVAVLTAGAPADIATILVPPGITRYRVFGATGATVPCVTAVATAAAGTLAAANFNFHDTAGGAGQRIANGLAGPASTALLTGGSADNNTLVTSGTIYVRQTIASANAGTVDLYITIWPLM